MHIVFLKFGAHRAQAGQWMAAHTQWIQQGLDDGAFLLAGALGDAQGGMVLTARMDPAEVRRRVDQDPLVVHGVVSAEIHAIAPSRMAPGMAALLGAP